MRPPNKYNTVFHFQSKNVVKKIVQIFLLEVLLCMYYYVMNLLIVICTMNLFNKCTEFHAEFLTANLI